MTWGKRHEKLEKDGDNIITNTLSCLSYFLPPPPFCRSTSRRQFEILAIDPVGLPSLSRSFKARPRRTRARPLLLLLLLPALFLSLPHTLLALLHCLSGSSSAYTPL